MRNESTPTQTHRWRIAGLVAAAVLAATTLSVGTSHAAEKKPPFVIGVSNDSVANPFRVQMINEIKYYASKHPELIKEGARVVIHDDVLATGGTVEAICKLVRQLGGEVVGACFIIELTLLGGRERLADLDVHALIEY